jgi:DNA-binding XRE family transcriptional regulator
MLITSDLGRRRSPKGPLLGGPPLLSAAAQAQIEAEKQRRATEWKQFRQTYLYSQSDLAYAIGCSVRTVRKVEAGGCIPLPRFQRRFRDLRRHEEGAGATGGEL